MDAPFRQRHTDTQERSGERGKQGRWEGSRIEFATRSTRLDPRGKLPLSLIRFGASCCLLLSAVAASRVAVASRGRLVRKNFHLERFVSTPLDTYMEAKYN